ncbi:unnamed protein product, partial [Schistosoma margrebowiei]
MTKCLQLDESIKTYGQHTMSKTYRAIYFGDLFTVTLEIRVLTEVPSVVDPSRFESKKARLDSTSSNSLPESRVLHIRGLPSDVNELEVSTLSIPFGSIANIILTRKNGQALIEMDTLESAESMFGYYTAICPPVLRGKYPLEVQFSKYSSLTNAMTNNAATSAVEEANKQFVTFQCENEDSPKTVLHIHIEKLHGSMEIGYLPFFMLEADNVFVGLPLFRFPSGFQVSACLVMQFGLRNVCPIHFHRLFLISSSAGS